MRRGFLLIVCTIFTLIAFGAGTVSPVLWRSSVESKGTSGEYNITLSAKITSPWHFYDLGPYTNGPFPTTFTFKPNPDIELIGELKENIKPKRIFDEIFQMEIGYYAQSASFTQSVRVKSETPTIIFVSVEYQACDNRSCLSPEEYTFSITLEGVTLPQGDTQQIETIAKTENAVLPSETKTTDLIPIVTEILPKPIIPTTELTVPQKNNSSLWSVIIEAILWGFAALLTPCVFPMVPMTVSYFIKGSENKTRGRFMASLYGISIVTLYTLPIAVIIFVTYLAGGETITADIFNWLATHWIPNVLFFIVFMLFAASFFGAFEITMPSQLVNKTDSKADKGGITGVFFMALTLVLVSFSCTGPIVGSILIKSTQGEIWEPILTMLAFSIAFSLPFTILAFFPSFLKNMPKSGGWLNSVKVVLGFLELALGLKFLSVADQTYHWGILDRELYLSLWIVIFSLLGMYLLGKLKFSHDSDVKHIGVTRLSLAIITFSFVVYMIPGMWGAPLKVLSGYMPPLHTQDFVLGNNTATLATTTTDIAKQKPKYSDFLHLPHGLEGFFEYNEALEYSRKVNKPLFVDFTGHGCVNCREMESKVWSDPRVLKLLRDNYVIVALYSDDKKELAQSDWVTTDKGKVLKSLGKINSHFANKKFGVNAQPYYIILNGNQQEVVPPRGYDLNINSFIQFLEAGINNYYSK